MGGRTIVQLRPTISAPLSQDMPNNKGVRNAINVTSARCHMCGLDTYDQLLVSVASNSKLVLFTNTKSHTGF